MTPQGRSTGLVLAHPEIAVPSPTNSVAIINGFGGSSRFGSFSIVVFLHLFESLLLPLNDQLVALPRQPAEAGSHGSGDKDRLPVREQERDEREHFRPAWQEVSARRSG